MPNIQLQRLPHAEGLPLPKRMTLHASGADVAAAIEADVVLAPGGRLLIPTGFALEIPPGYEVQVRPRSGLAIKHGVTVLNAPGTIDADYRGEIKVILINLGESPFEIRRGDRIAQMVFKRTERVMWREVECLPESGRGHGGFGSTGRR